MNNIYETAKDLYQMFTKQNIRELYVNADDPEFLRISRSSWNSENAFIVFNNVNPKSNKYEQINLIVKELHKKIEMNSYNEMDYAIAMLKGEI